jgi:hypothetical protein
MLAKRYDVAMKKANTKKLRSLDIKPAVKKIPSKPKKTTGLSKSDPDYYSKIGAISAAKRKISSETFADWARRSHEARRKNKKKAAKDGK